VVNRRRDKYVILEHEQYNPKSDHAIAVYDVNGDQLGYISDDLAADIIDDVRKAGPIKAAILNVSGGEDGKNFGCNIEIPDLLAPVEPLPTPENDDAVAHAALSKGASYLMLLGIAAIAAYMIIQSSDRPQSKTISEEPPSSAIMITEAPQIISSPDLAAPLTEAEIAAQEEQKKAAEREAKKAAEEAKKQEEQKKKAMQAELNELRKQMRSKTDQVEGTKWIHDKATPNSSSGNMFYLYLGQKGSYMWIRLMASFTAEDWIFFESLIVNYDGSLATIPFNKYDVYRDNNGRIVHEAIDLEISNYLGLMKLISESKKTIIRFSGEHRRHDFTLSQKQKGALKRIIRLYELMK
jgi:hypothetical protein